jgi:hypothetical protein
LNPFNRLDRRMSFPLVYITPPAPPHARHPTSWLQVAPPRLPGLSLASKSFALGLTPESHPPPHSLQGKSWLPRHTTRHSEFGLAGPDFNESINRVMLNS